jgi:TIR domain
MSMLHLGFGPRLSTPGTWSIFGYLAIGPFRTVMTDIFLSYSSIDVDRVRPIRDALAERGFDVFWDQTLPPGKDWDTWIREHLSKSKCALIVWSKNSVKSDNVRHEATIAKRLGKLLAALIDDLDPEEFPMGLYASQSAKLGLWSGDPHDDAWLKLQREVENRLTPLWVKQSIDQTEAELFAEQARREAAEKRNKTLRDQIEKEPSSSSVLPTSCRSGRGLCCESWAMTSFQDASPHWSTC